MNLKQLVYRLVKSQKSHSVKISTNFNIIDFTKEIKESDNNIFIQSALKIDNFSLNIYFEDHFSKTYCIKEVDKFIKEWTQRQKQNTGNKFLKQDTLTGEHMR